MTVATSLDKVKQLTVYMKKQNTKIQLDHSKLLGFRKTKAVKNSLKPLTVAMVGAAKVGVVKA